jgi:hypothetical protein
MKYAAEMGSGAMTYAKFHKNWFIHSKVDAMGVYRHRQQGDLIRLLSLFQNKESRLIKQFSDACVIIFHSANTEISEIAFG